MAHIEKYFQDVMDKGGEGIILRDPASPLQPGRSAGFLKHKVGSIRMLLTCERRQTTSIRNIEMRKPV